MGFLPAGETTKACPLAKARRRQGNPSFLLCVLRVPCERRVLVASKHQKPFSRGGAETRRKPVSALLCGFAALREAWVLFLIGSTTKGNPLAKARRREGNRLMGLSYSAFSACSAREMSLWLRNTKNRSLAEALRRGENPILLSFAASRLCERHGFCSFQKRDQRQSSRKAAKAQRNRLKFFSLCVLRVLCERNVFVASKSVGRTRHRRLRRTMAPVACRWWM
jgi:hypothetical protein